MASCKGCDFKSADPKEWDGAPSPYHDVRCPRCGTTAVDTSDWNREGDYGYGDDNSLRMNRDG